MEPILQIKNLTHTYGVGTPFQRSAVEDMTFDVYQGEFLGIIGHTGSGKSTLILHLNGLLKPNSGTLYLRDKNIWSKENEKNIRSVRFAVGLCFQYPEYQIFEETIYKEIAFGPKQMGLDENEIRERVYRSMDFVGIDRAIENKSPFDLSGGQKRRVAIASIIAMKPQVLVLDEPCAGLDPKGRDTILGLIKDYQRLEGNTVLLVSHSMEDVAKIADRVLVMNRGKVAMFGTVPEVYSRGDELKKMGLNVPEITDIFIKLNKMGIPCRTDIFTVQQGVDEFRRLKMKKEVAEL